MLKKAPQGNSPKLRRKSVGLAGRQAAFTDGDIPQQGIPSKSGVSPDLISFSHKRVFMKPSLFCLQIDSASADFFYAP
jgi:hypothetical protein